MNSACFNTLTFRESSPHSCNCQGLDLLTGGSSPCKKVKENVCKVICPYTENQSEKGYWPGINSLTCGGFRTVNRSQCLTHSQLLSHMSCKFHCYSADTSGSQCPTFHIVDNSPQQFLPRIGLHSVAGLRWIADSLHTGACLVTS